MFNLKQIEKPVTIDEGDSFKVVLSKYGASALDKQENLSELTGLSVSAISRIETGHNSTSLKTLYKICTVLDVSLDYILYDILSNETKNIDPTISDILVLLDSLTEKQKVCVRDILKLYLASL